MAENKETEWHSQYGWNAAKSVQQFNYELQQIADILFA